MRVAVGGDCCDVGVRVEVLVVLPVRDGVAFWASHPKGPQVGTLAGVASVKGLSTLMRAVVVSEAGGLPLSVQTKVTLKTSPAWLAFVRWR